MEPDILGRAYEYLLRKFAEGQGQSAGEFYTPREVGVLMARILNPEPGVSIYDPTCGSGGLLIKCHLRLIETHGEQRNSHRELTPGVPPLQAFGQEINTATFAMARMNSFIHDMEADIAVGDTMASPRFTEGDGRLRRFDEIADRHGLEKIKTIGDAYMAVAGAPVPVADHAEAAVAVALDILAEAGEVELRRDRTVVWSDGPTAPG